MTEVSLAVAPSLVSYDTSVRREGLYDVPKETFWAEFVGSWGTEWRRREDDGILDILVNLSSPQAFIFKKAFPTDGANCRNIKCNS